VHNPAYFMALALERAKEALRLGEIPIGAILVAEDGTMATGYNCPISHHDPTAHAEVCAIRMMCQMQQNYRLPDCTLYVTLQPCLMCLGAITHSRIKNVYFGAYETKYRIEYPKNTGITFHGPILEKECAAILSDFFKSKRT